MIQGVFSSRAERPFLWRTTTDTRTQLSKSLALLLTLVLVTSTIISCKPGDGRSTPSSSRDLESLTPDDQVLVLWYSLPQSHEEVLLELVDAFNTDNEWDISIIAESFGSTDDVYEKVSARIGSGATPELVIAESYQVAAYAERGALVALDRYLADFKWGYTADEMEDFFRVILITDELPTLKDRYSWPLYKSVDVLYYNEDWLIELGYTEPPKTWDQFTEMACAASEAEAGTYGYQFSANATTFADILFSMDGQMVDNSATTYTFDGPEGLTTLTFVQGLLEGGCATLKTRHDGERVDFGAGKVLFTIDSASSVPQYHRTVDEDAGFKWSIAPLPTSLERPKLRMYGPGLSVLQSTPEKQLAAWVFLKWLTEPEQQARWAERFSHIPTRASTVDLLQESLAENPQYRVALGFLGYDVAVEPGIAGYGECRRAIEEMLRETTSFEDVTTGLAQAVERCNRSLSQATQP